MYDDYIHNEIEIEEFFSKMHKIYSDGNESIQEFYQLLLEDILQECGGEKTKLFRKKELKKEKEREIDAILFIYNGFINSVKDSDDDDEEITQNNSVNSDISIDHDKKSANRNKNMNKNKNKKSKKKESKKKGKEKGKKDEKKSKSKNKEKRSRSRKKETKTKVKPIQLIDESDRDGDVEIEVDTDEDVLDEEYSVDINISDNKNGKKTKLRKKNTNGTLWTDKEIERFKYHAMQFKPSYDNQTHGITQLSLKISKKMKKDKLNRSQWGVYPKLRDFYEKIDKNNAQS